MRKSTIFIIMLMLLIVSGCGAKKVTNNHIKTTTQKVINAPSKTWSFSKEVKSDLTRKGPSNDMAPSSVSKENSLATWKTEDGEFTSDSIQYQQISVAEWKKNLQKNYMQSYQSKIHYMSISQINAVLKTLGSDIKISQLSDLIFLKHVTGSLPVTQAFVAKNHTLYAINMHYMEDDPAHTINRGQSFTDVDHKKTADHVAVKALNGTWIAPKTVTSAEDSGKILIQDGYLYQHRYNSIERSAVEDLSAYPLAKLNQNTTYTMKKREAGWAGYQLTDKNIASGDSLGYLYLFINPKEMVRIGAGQTTSYEKTGDTVSGTDLPQDYLTIFNKPDSKNQVISTITVKSDAPIIGKTSSIKYLTDDLAGQISEK